jgi:hypothetical protein
MGSWDDWYVADGLHTCDYIASGTGLGYKTALTSDYPRFAGGGVFQGWFYGVLAYGGDPSPDGDYGPKTNDYSDFAGTLGMGTYVTGVAGTSLLSVGVYGQTGEDLNSSIPKDLLAGVVGAANTGSGVAGWSTTGNGVEGWAYQGTAVRGISDYGYGVRGVSYAQRGVFGLSAIDTGVVGVSGGLEGPTVPNTSNIAAVVGTSDQQHGVIGTSNASVGVIGFSNNIGVLGYTTTPGSLAGFFLGNIVVTGTKSAAVPFPDGTQRALYCMESPELWFEDFGTAKIARGRAVVKLDADFAKVIKSRDYRVFVTPEGDCRGLYVHRKSANSFEVRELTGGTSSIAFSYRIVGRRKDIKEHRRFAKVDMRLSLPVAPPRKPAPTVAGLRAFVARVEKEARERRPKGAEKGRRPGRKRSRADFRRLLMQQPPRAEKK